METYPQVREEDESLVYLAGGGMAAMLLGVALIPLRDFTTASNFTFPFMALTIVVAEFGGRRAAIVTALVSALSLDFFLTQPYLRLTIAGKHDMIAFVGLAACGLIAAGLRTHGRGRIARLSTATGHLDLLQRALRRVEDGGSLEQVLTRILEDARAALPVVAMGVRDRQGRLLAASESVREKQSPLQDLSRDTLLPSGARLLPRGGVPLPEEGGRLSLRAGDREVGYFELWGNGEPADAQARRTIADLGRLVSLLLTERAKGPM